MNIDARTVRLAGPAVEPITLAEAKLHLRVDTTADNDYITGLIEAARVHCEQVSGRSFVTQTITGGIAGWPNDGVIRLIYSPLQSVTSIKYTDEDGDESTLSTDVYGVDTKLDLVYLKNGQTWPADVLRDYDPITVTWVAGYGLAATVPETYKHAIKLLIGHWYENRESVIVEAGVAATEVPQTIDDLLMINGVNW